MGAALDVGLQWMHDAGVLAVLLPELEATVDFSQEAGRRHKDVWEHTKQVVRQSVPKPARALGGAAARHRQGADARDAARRARDLPPPRRGGRAHVRSASRGGWASTSHERQQDPLPDPAPPARQRLRAELDRRGRAPLRSRDGRAPRRSARPVARRRHLAPAGAARRRRSRNIHALQGAHPGDPRRWTRACRRCRPAWATRSWRPSRCRRRGGSATCASCARTPSSAASWRSAATPRYYVDFLRASRASPAVRTRAYEPPRVVECAFERFVAVPSC